MAQAEENAEVIRKRVLDDWLQVLTQLETERQLYARACEPLPREFVEKLKIASLEIRVSVKELPHHHEPEIVDGGSEDREQKLSLKRLKLVS